MVVKRVGVWSLGRVLGIIYAGFGLLVGLFFSLFSMVGMGMGMMAGRSGMALFPMFFGAGAIVLLPIVYGILGLIGGGLAAIFYNVAAAIGGGLEIEVS